MKPISCLKHPTTVVCVDDDSRFLDTLRTLLTTADICCKTFDKHQLAIPHINADTYRQEFTHSLNHVENDDEFIESSLQVFVNELKKPKRYDQVSVVVVDYDMPGMNGLQLCESLINPHVKVIMLTGAADETLAVRAFNKGLIYQFVRKQDHYFVEQLIEAIHKAQQDYFHDISQFSLEILKNRSHPTALTESAFKDYFQNLLSTHRIKEYYLAEETGSFIMVDDKKKLHSLVTLSDDLIDVLLDSYNPDTLTPAQIEAITLRRLMPCYYNPFVKPNYITKNLQDFLYKPTIIQGQRHKFYSVWGEGLIPINHTSID